MKKSILLAFVAMVLAVVGCKKEEVMESVSFDTHTQAHIETLTHTGT